MILQIDRCPDPIGILRVEVVQALDLMGKDIRVLQSNTSDPYAIFSIDKKEPMFTVRLMRNLSIISVYESSYYCRHKNHYVLCDYNFVILDPHCRPISQPSMEHIWRVLRSVKW